MVKIEPTNRHDIHALVDHVPYNPLRLSAFLMREHDFGSCDFCKCFVLSL